MILVEKFFLWILSHERVVSCEFTFQGSHASFVEVSTSRQWLIKFVSHVIIRIYRIAQNIGVLVGIDFEGKLIFDGSQLLLLTDYVINEIVVLLDSVLVRRLDWRGEPVENCVKLIENIESLLMVIYITDGNVFHIELN